MDFVLIPGMWLPGSVWDPVTAHLTSLGHRATALTLPGQGDGNRSAALDDQVTAVIAAVDAAPGGAVVVGHGVRLPRLDGGRPAAGRCASCRAGWRVPERRR